MDLNQLVKNVVLTKVCSISPDKDSDDSKQITLKVKFDNVPLQGVFDKAIAQTVIQWQNGPGRKKFDTWRNGQVVEVNFKSPARAMIDPKQALINDAINAGVDVNDKNALTAYIMQQIEKSR